MTPVEQAKRKVAAIFFALSSDFDTRWTELMRGGWEAVTSLPSSTLRGYVGADGEYEVSVVKACGNEKEIRIMLASGSFAQYSNETACKEVPRS